MVLSKAGTCSKALLLTASMVETCVRIVEYVPPSWCDHRAALNCLKRTSYPDRVPSEGCRRVTGTMVRVPKLPRGHVPLMLEHLGVLLYHKVQECHVTHGACVGVRSLLYKGVLISNV